MSLISCFFLSSCSFADFSAAFSFIKSESNLFFNDSLTAGELT